MKVPPSVKATIDSLFKDVIRAKVTLSPTMLPGERMGGGERQRELEGRGGMEGGASRGENYRFKRNNERKTRGRERKTNGEGGGLLRHTSTF
eukprot:960675-Amorphochlora_amoeboformis.AAC.1